MLETCLNNKIIRDFLKNYKQSQWQKLIPSLIEIAILNLNSSFHTLIFTESDIKNILDELKLNQNSNIPNTPNTNNNRNSNSNIPNKQNFNNSKKGHIIFSKPSDKWRTADGGIPPIQGVAKKNENLDHEIYFENTSLTNNSKYSRDNKDLIKENIMNKRIIKNTQSKIKEQIENDRRQYYNKMNAMNGKNNNIKPIEKINYAISYDKNLEPEIIEKTTISKNKKGGKIVEKMTQEEYEQKFPDEEENVENEYEEEEDNEDNEEILYQEEEDENNINDNNININNKINNINKNINNKMKPKNINNNINIIDKENNRRKNLYHYKTDINNKPNINNDIIMNNINQGKKQMMQNSQQQSFNPKNFQNNIQNQNIINNNKNNYINIENNTNEPQNMNMNRSENYDYNNNSSQNQIPSEQYNNINNNYKIGVSESEEKSSKFIGIEQKYQKKIDELEQNIMNNNNINNNMNQNINNIDNYGDKVNVNITNMEEYSKGMSQNQNNNININNNEEEEDENDMEENEGDGILSQMSNMSDKTKSLFKRTMDEYPLADEDTLYEQSQNK